MSSDCAERTCQEAEEIAQRMSGVEKAKLAVPTNNPMLSIDPEELVKLGTGYSHIKPGIHRYSAQGHVGTCDGHSRSFG